MGLFNVILKFGFRRGFYGMVNCNTENSKCIELTMNLFVWFFLLLLLFLFLFLRVCVGGCVGVCGNQKSVFIKFRLQCTMPSSFKNYRVGPNTHIYE